MLHISVSTALADRFSSLLVARPNQWLGGERWFAHLVPVVDDEMVLVLELKTRYSMVFHRLRDSDYGRFPDVFLNRLCSEVAEICQLAGKQANNLVELISLETQPMQFGIGLDRTIARDMFDVARHLQSIVEDLGGYPVMGLSESDLGAKLNQVPVRGGTDLELTPKHQFADYWRQRLFVNRQQHVALSNTKFASAENIVPIASALNKNR